MSTLFFCYACGSNLVHISGPRLKCYGCGKYVAHSYDNKAVCSCRRRMPAFKYSIEIVAPHKGKCLCCGKEAEVEGNLEPPYMDTRRSSGRDSNFSVSPLKRTIPPKKILIDFNPDIYDEIDQFIIIGELPLHQHTEQIERSIDNGILTIKSLLAGVDFKRQFPIPTDAIAETCEVNLRNCILEIRFQKRN